MSSHGQPIGICIFWNYTFCGHCREHRARCLCSSACSYPDLLGARLTPKSSCTSFAFQLCSILSILDGIHRLQVQHTDTSLRPVSVRLHHQYITEEYAPHYED